MPGPLLIMWILAQFHSVLGIEGPCKHCDMSVLTGAGTGTLFCWGMLTAESPSSL